MARQIFHALNMRYKGQPTLSVTIDGTAKVSSQQMPSHSIMRNRRMELPAGIVGYVPQIQSTFTGALTTEFEGAPEAKYVQQQLFHFFEVQFDGTVKLEIYSDEVLQVLNNSGETNITLTVRDSKKQDTRRVYFPPLTYGWVPQLKHVVNSASDGQVYKSVLRSLPSRFSRGEKEHSEIQVTHQGDVGLDVFLDGKILDTYGFNADSYDKNAFITEKEYLPAGCVGNVLQWIQKDGTGEVAMFETNTTLTDRDQPQQEV
jgi:hypothetical protein